MSDEQQDTGQATPVQIRVRFAPSPTGGLHIGGARTAYFNWLFARQNGGAFVLRIDDTDQKRSTQESYEQILASFKWLGIDWDEGPGVGGPYGPYRQSERSEMYHAHLRHLVDKGQVYPCFCSAEELAAEREAAQQRGETPRYSGHCRNLPEDEVKERLDRGERPAYRLRSEGLGTTVVHDLIRGDVEFQNTELDDFVVWKADNSPTYHFASCVDDGMMHITHVIRAEEHLSNTPRHIALFEALGFPVPQFAHVPMILAPDRSKLSKRHGATSVEEYRTGGILPQALVNYLLLLGFSPGDDAEVVTREQAVQLFQLTRVAKHAAVYDTKKLEWLNAQYLRQLSVDALQAEIWPQLQARGWVDPLMTREQLAWVRTAVGSMQERARTLNELVDSLNFYFEPVTEYDEKGVRKHFSKEGVAERLKDAAAAVGSVQPFTMAEIERTYRSLIDEWGLKSGDLIHPTRLALTGLTAGPGLFDLMAILGRDVCAERMHRAAGRIEAGFAS